MYRRQEDQRGERIEDPDGQHCEDQGEGGDGCRTARIRGLRPPSQERANEQPGENRRGHASAQRSERGAVERVDAGVRRRSAGVRRLVEQHEQLRHRERGQERQRPERDRPPPSGRVLVPPACARVCVDRGHERGQEQRRGQHHEHPSGQDLPADRHVRVRAVLGLLGRGVERAGQPQRRAAELAEPVDVHVLEPARVLGRRQLAAARDPDRLDPVGEQGALGAEPERVRQPDELAERPLLGRLGAELLAHGSRRGALKADAAAAVVGGPRDDKRAARRARTQVRQHDDRLDPVAVLRGAREAPRSGIAERAPVNRRQHERLPRRPALDHARELEQRGRVGGAAGGIRDRLRVARGHDHDLVARRPGTARDHVGEPLAVLGPGVNGRLEALFLERAEALGEVARSRRARQLARAPVRMPRDDPAQLAMRDVAVEQHIGREPLRHRPGPVLEREHHEHHGQDGRDERRAVDPGLDHQANLQFPKGSKRPFQRIGAG